MDKFSNILKQAIEIKSFETIDTDVAWTKFMENMDTDIEEDLTSIPIFQINDSLVTKKRHNFYRIGLAAASVLIILFASQIQPNNDQLLTFSTTTKPDSIALPDGSYAYLDVNTKITYPKTFENLSERKIDLEGDGRFSVAKNRFQPFRVYNNDVVTEALGTIFKIKQLNKDLDITNVEGSIKVFLQQEPAKFFVVAQGQTINYKNGLLIPQVDTILVVTQPEILNQPLESKKPLLVKEEIAEEKVVEPEAAPQLSTFIVEAVVKNQLIKMHKKQIKLAKSAKFTGTTRVKIDISKSPEEILKELKSQGFIDYIPGECEGCWIITKGTKE